MKTMPIIPNFPFAAIIGQDEMKLALQLNIINPQIGGVMITGERGTGKSTTIRALVDVLPTISVIKNDAFNTDPKSLPFKDRKFYKIEKIKTPMVELPLGSTDDHICGSINIKEVMTSGEKIFEPGLLARANRGFLYVDEINLLDDHLVDLLLDSAASGWNVVEREGISIKHPAKFILIGSGNPEEGELRPQLADRFGMYTEIKTIKDPSLRIQIIQQRVCFDEAPAKYIEKYTKEQKAIEDRILKAQSILPEVQISKDFQLKISKICSEACIEGLRGDISCIRAAKALAAFNLRTNVIAHDIHKTICLCLKHRLHKDVCTDEQLKNLIKKIFSLS